MNRLNICRDKSRVSLLPHNRSLSCVCAAYVEPRILRSSQAACSTPVHGYTSNIIYECDLQSPFQTRVYPILSRVLKLKQNRMRPSCVLLINLGDDDLSDMFWPQCVNVTRYPLTPDVNRGYPWEWVTYYSIQPSLCMFQPEKRSNMFVTVY